MYIPVHSYKYAFILPNGLVRYSDSHWKDNDAIAGFELANQGHNTYFLYAVETIKEHRNKGLMTKLLTKILSDHKTYQLDVEKDNEVAIAVYKKVGFKIAEESWSNAWRMERNEKIRI